MDQSVRFESKTCIIPVSQVTISLCLVLCKYHYK